MSQPPFGQQSGQPQYGQGAYQGGYTQPQQQGGYGQPAQPAYGQQQPGYRQPYYGAGAAPGRSAAGRRFGVVGTVLALVGAAAVVIAFLGPNWGDGANGKFSDIHTFVTTAGAGTSVASLAHVYFNWLAWVLLAASALLALLANAPTGVAPALRIVGTLVGLGSAVATLFALKIISSGRGLSWYIKHSDVGYWLAIAGFVVMAVGALIGPRRAA